MTRRDPCVAERELCERIRALVDGTNVGTNVVTTTCDYAGVARAYARVARDIAEQEMNKRPALERLLDG